MAIAGPGPSKQELSGGVFKDQWEQAISVLEFATAVVFVGYRFPPTDAEARQRLLGALRNNAREKHLPVHVVLGPRTGDDDPRRLTGLIEHAMAGKRIRRPWRLVDQSGARSYDISLQPLWAQDFFSVVERESILRPE